MSTDNYVKYISEQVHKEKVRGFKDIAINEDLQFDSEEFDDIVEAVIDALAEDVQDLQELSPELKSKYLHKAVANIQKRGIRSGRTGEKDPKIAKRVAGVAKAGGSEDKAKDTAKYAKQYGKQASKPMPNDDDKWDDEYQKRDITHTYMRASGRSAKKPK
jgi:predicted transcriptional regulator